MKKKKLDFSIFKSTRSMEITALILILLCIVLSLVKHFHTQNETTDGSTNIEDAENTISVFGTEQSDSETITLTDDTEEPAGSDSYGHDDSQDNYFAYGEASFDDLDYSVWAICNISDYLDEYLKSQGYFGTRLYMINDSKYVDGDYSYFEARIDDSSERVCVGYTNGDDNFDFLIKLEP